MSGSRFNVTVLLTAIILLLAQACAPVDQKKAPNNDEFEKAQGYVGELVAVQMTSYMYGSHVLLTSEGRFAVSAAKDANVDLEDYENQRVTVEGALVPGYPVDGCPPYLRVHSIQPAD